MTERTIKILGVQFAANPDYKFGDPETPEIWMRTINLLTEGCFFTGQNARDIIG